jgi:hypothetical protein
MIRVTGGAAPSIFSGGLEMNPAKSLTLRCMVHDWYLAEAHDGLTRPVAHSFFAT